MKKVLDYKFTLRGLKGVSYTIDGGHKFISFVFNEFPSPITFRVGKDEVICNYRKIAKFFRQISIQRSIPLKIKLMVNIKPFLKKLSDGQIKSQTKII